MYHDERPSVRDILERYPVKPDGDPFVWPPPAEASWKSPATVARRMLAVLDWRATLPVNDWNEIHDYRTDIGWHAEGYPVEPVTVPDLVNRIEAQYVA